MTYHAAISPGAADLLGVPSTSEPTFTCDWCGTVKSGYTKRGDIAQWMLNRRCPPGWRQIEGVPSPGHLCGECLRKAAEKAPKRRQIA